MDMANIHLPCLNTYIHSKFAGCVSAKFIFLCTQKDIAYAHTHTYIHTQTHIQTHTYTHTNTHIQTHTHTQSYKIGF